MICTHITQNVDETYIKTDNRESQQSYRLGTVIN